MAQIKRYALLARLRADTSSYIQYYRSGRIVRAGRGLAFWFAPDGASITEVPIDDRQMPFVIKGQSADYQELTVQGVVVWRVVDPAILADRIDFTIDLQSGGLTGQPIDQINAVLVGLVRQITYGYLRQQGVRELLSGGVAPLQDMVSELLENHPTLAGLGLEMVGTSIANLAPTSELARALEVPTFEGLQQQADEATFARRAMAVEKERAIAENELNNQIELAAQQKDLIAREMSNARLKAEADAENRKIGVEADAAMRVVRAEADAQSIRTTELAKVETEQARMEIFGRLPPEVLLSLAAQELAEKVKSIDNLTITPDMMTGLMRQLGDMFGKNGRLKEPAP